jgi:hypothetical protein
MTSINMGTLQAPALKKENHNKKKAAGKQHKSSILAGMAVVRS